MEEERYISHHTFSRRSILVSKNEDFPNWFFWIRPKKLVSVSQQLRNSNIFLASRQIWGSKPNHIVPFNHLQPQELSSRFGRCINNPITQRRVTLNCVLQCDSQCVLKTDRARELISPGNSNVTVCAMNMASRVITTKNSWKQIRMIQRGLDGTREELEEGYLQYPVTYLLAQLDLSSQNEFS